MSGYQKKNLKREVENQAPKFGMPAELEARFARRALGGETLGLSHMKLAPGFRIPFGHKHSNQAFGAGDDPRDAEIVQGWWSDENEAS